MNYRVNIKVVMFTIILGLLGCTQSESEADDQYLSTLKQGLTVSGSIIIEEMRRTGVLSTISFQQARADLQLVNGTKYPLQFGQTLMFIEANAEKNYYNGVLAGIQQPLDAEGRHTWEPPGAYGLSTKQAHFVDGYSFTSGSFQAIFFMNTSDFTDDFIKNVIPDEIPEESQTPFHMTFNLSKWLKEASCANVLLVLPEIRVDMNQNASRYRLIISFKKSPDQNNTWEVDHQYLWIPLNQDELSQLLASTSVDMITRILVANWWIESNPDEARVAITNIGQQLHKGELLSVFLKLLTEHKDDSLAVHASNLLELESIPPGIITTATIYLVTLGKEPDLSALLRLASGSDDDAARQAIFLLGRIDSPQAIDGLKKMLEDSTLSARHKQIRANLETEEKKIKERGSQ